VGLWRRLLEELKPYTADDRRRDFQKRQWRKRVDGQTAAARNPQAQPGAWVYMLGDQQRVYARPLECNEKTVRAQHRAVQQ
jgi:hypothetical protein